MKNVITNINYYQNRSAKRLNSEQAAYIPIIEKDQIEFTVHTYRVENTRIMINQESQLCFRLRYIKFMPIDARTKARCINKTDSLTNFINNKIVKPIILFINGRCIPQDSITLTICPDCAYLTVDFSTEETSNIKDLVMEIQYAQIMLLPSYVEYTKTPTSEDLNNILFAFNSHCLYNLANSCSYYIIKNEPHVFTSSKRLYPPVIGVDLNSFELEDGTTVALNNLKFEKENVILFHSGRLAIGETDNIRRAFDWDYQNPDSNDYAPKVEILQSTNEPHKNIDIRLDSSFITIDNGNPESQRYDIVVCVNTEYSNTIDNIYNVEKDFLRNKVEEMVVADQTPEFYEMLKDEFKFEMDITKDYSTNITNAIKAMLKYNSNAFNWSYIQNSNLLIEDYPTDELLSNVSEEDGTISIPRQHSAMVEEFIIMLVNGCLYKYDYMIKHIANLCIIPIQEISSTDKIELLRFRNVNNNVYDITVGEEDGFVYYSPDIVNDHMVLFSNEPMVDDPYEYPNDGSQYFPIEYSLETDENGLIKIILNEPFYYDKPLKIAYNNRYHHASYVAGKSEYRHYYVDLKDKFNFCYDYSKYLVFLNGKKLDSKFYRPVLPVRKTTPFYAYKLYFSVLVEEGDRLDIIYTPSLMKDIKCDQQVDITGDVVVSKDILKYGLGSELYMIWINGRKIPKDHIEDIDATHLKITTDEKSIHNLCVTKYIPDIDILIDSFISDDSEWDKVTSMLNKTELLAMLGINEIQITDTDTDIGEGGVPIKTIMKELIREQYLMNPKVDITGKFVYDYLDVDDTVIKDEDGNIVTDNEGNIIIDVADANKQDNLSNIRRIYK